MNLNDFICRGSAVKSSGGADMLGTAKTADLLPDIDSHIVESLP